MSKKILDSSFIDAIPDSIREDSNVRAIASSLDSEIRRMASALETVQWSSPAIDTGVVDSSRLQQLTEDQLDHVAWGWGSVVWDRDWNGAHKRSYIAGLLNRKKHLGTPECIRDAFSQLGIEISIVDCMNSSTVSPGYFMIYTDEPVVMESQWKMLYIVDHIKPASRHYTWGHRITTEGGSVAAVGAYPILMHRFNFIAAQPLYEFNLSGYDAGGATVGSFVTLDFEAVQPPSTNGYLYDAATDTLTAALWDDDAETVEVD